MHSLVFLLFSTLSLAATPELKSVEDLRKACDQVEKDARTVLEPRVPGSCSGFFTFLTTSQTELRSEIGGDKGVVKFCRDLARDLEELRKYRQGVSAGCTAVGVGAAQASTRSGRNQKALAGAAAASRTAIGQQNSDCAGQLVPIVRKPSKDFNMVPPAGAEAAPAAPPKLSYPALEKRVAERQTVYGNNTRKTDAAVSYSEQKDSCGQLAQDYLNLDRRTHRAMSAMMDVVSLEHSGAISELENYRRKAATALGSGKAVRQTVESLSSGTVREPVLYNNVDDEPEGTVIPEPKASGTFHDPDGE